MPDSTWILGAGLTGLAASWASGRPVFEAAPAPGGICRSYYLCPGESEPRGVPSVEVGAYRFEVGGGHWICGVDPGLRGFLAAFGDWREHPLETSIFFPESRLLIPAPIHYNLRSLDPTLASWALDELRRAPARLSGDSALTMAGWTEQCFGPTLTDLFFGPFNELYTAGLSREVAPLDPAHNPVDLNLVDRGLRQDVRDSTQAGGFLYPDGGLSAFTDSLAAAAGVRCRMRAVRIDTNQRRVEFEDGSAVAYTNLVSTLPLDLVLRLANIQISQPADPSTAALILNIGGLQGPSCPASHCVYVPRSRSGFHRIGVYSNYDPSSTPQGLAGRASFFVERAFRSGRAPVSAEVAAYSQSVLDELQEWGFLESAEAVHATWVDTARTWSRPGSTWRQAALDALAQHGILSTGRFGGWRRQGMAESLRDGILAGASLRALG